jgi:hypothetical protein
MKRKSNAKLGRPECVRHINVKSVPAVTMYGGGGLEVKLRIFLIAVS